MVRLIGFPIFFLSRAGPDAAITEGIVHTVEAAGGALRVVRTKAFGGYAS
ncbi:MAG: hypothetical protein WAL40_04995 [Rhodoplanes sp.]